MKLASKDQIKFWKLEGRSPTNVLFLFLYQLVAVWPIAFALLFVYLIEPEINFVSRTHEFLLEFGVSLNLQLANLLGGFALTGFIFLGFLYVAIVPYLEIVKFPQKTVEGAKLFFIFLLNLLIVISFGGSPKEIFLAYGFINFMSFFLLILIGLLSAIQSAFPDSFRNKKIKIG